MNAVDRVTMARSKDRPGADEYMAALIDDLVLMAGDRCFGEDPAVAGGIGFFRGVPVTAIATKKGKDLEENIACRFGMPDPEGYRKAERLMRQAEKFRRPVITFIDTPGAYPGKDAEERGQGGAIAKCIQTMSRLRVPVIAAFTGEGGSGGALAFASADRIIMMENSIFSILSPEGFASILWHDSSKWKEACDQMKLTAEDLARLGICDDIVAEPENAEKADKAAYFDALGDAVWRALRQLDGMSPEEYADRRYLKLRKIGSKYGRDKDKRIWTRSR